MRPKLIFEDQLKEYIDVGKIRIREDNRKIEILKFLGGEEWRRINKIVMKYGYRYIHEGRGWLYTGWFPPIIVPDFWDLRDREVVIRHGADPIIGELFYLVKDGRITWIVPVSGNPNAIYVYDPLNEKGFEGAQVTFTLVDGRKVSFRGPWHSNPEALYERTGIDLRVKRTCPYNYTDPEKECPYYENGVGRFACKKRLTEWDDPCGERCVKLII